jgi:predicted ATP-grasp superfamily ATP-dependent carboligase
MLAHGDAIDAEVTAPAAPPVHAPDRGEAAGLARAGRGAAPPNVLLICGLFGLPYRAMRCAQAAGARVHVLGNHGARGFKYSRYCESFSRLDRPLDGTFDAALADLINACTDRLRIDIVMAGDQPSARSLAGLKKLLRARCYPMPDLATFDLLNDKFEFYRLCSRLGILSPPTSLFDDAGAVAQAIEAKHLSTPLIAKPLSLDAARGVVRLDSATWKTALAAVRYEPVLVQAFIEGVDIGASAYCDRGEIRAFILHRLADATYTAFTDQGVLNAIQKIVADTLYSGVCNFDMRLAPDGKIYFLECNPRFFYKMDMSLIAGVNFVAHGLYPDMERNFVSGPAVRLHKAMLAKLATPWRLTRRDFAMLAYRHLDPISYWRQCLHIDWEDPTY